MRSGRKDLSSLVFHCQAEEKKLWGSVPGEDNYMVPTEDASEVNYSKL